MLRNELIVLLKKGFEFISTTQFHMSENGNRENTPLGDLLLSEFLQTVHATQFESLDESIIAACKHFKQALEDPDQTRKPCQSVVTKNYADYAIFMARLAIDEWAKTHLSIIGFDGKGEHYTAIVLNRDRAFWVSPYGLANLSTSRVSWYELEPYATEVLNLYIKESGQTPIES